MVEQCECCRFNSAVSRASDPTCGRFLPVSTTSHAPFNQHGNLSLTAGGGGFGGTGAYIEGGSGGFFHRRLTHAQITTNSGFAVQAAFDYKGGVDGGLGPQNARPTIGKQRLFAFGWLVEMDWSDETLRAYSCDDEGTITSGAWYEQEMTKFLDSLWWQQVSQVVTIFVKITERKLGESQFRRVISVSGGLNPHGNSPNKPVASKDFIETAVPFYYGWNAEYLGDEMHIGTPLITCVHQVNLPNGVIQTPASPWSIIYYNWWCEQQPLILKLDLTGMTPLYEESFPDYPYVYLIPGIRGGTGNVRTGFTPADWGFCNRFATGDISPSHVVAEVFFGINDPSGTTYPWGLAGQIEEYWASGAGVLHGYYYSPGTASVTPKPSGWDCDPSVAQSLPAFDLFDPEYEANPDSFNFEPEGLITPPSPP